jgi:signal transduction histidine kinase
MITDVLLVDDERQILTILQESLTSSGFRVRIAESGEMAVEAMKESPPDVMVVDLRMPGMNGLELMTEAQDHMPSGPMIVLTGYSDTKSAVDALRLGAYDYLTKPVDMERLVQTLRNAAEHRRLTLENRGLVHRLQEANRIKTEFINGMSHEVRTPLGHVMGFTEILQDTLEGLTDKQRGYLDKIRDAANRLLRLFDDVLQFSVLRSGDIQVKPEMLPLDSIVSRVVEDQASAAAARSIAVDAPAAGLEAHMDPEVSEKILTLLLDNAIKFTPEGGRVDIRAEAVMASERLPEVEHASPTGRWLRVGVSDTGPGVPDADRARIFEVFEQGDSSLSRSHEGTGLGLALARSLARIHGGDVILEKSSAEGSTFCMILPDGGE